MNLAECYAATNQIDLCKQAIGKLRARVGIPSTNNYGLDTYVFDRASALAACLRERQVELAYEGKRYWDIWRWMLYDGGRGEAMQLSTTNTCSFLGVTPLTERYRTAKYVDVKMDILQAVKMCCRNCVRIYLQTLNLPISRSNLKKWLIFGSLISSTGSPMCNLIRTTAMNGLRSDGDLIII